MGAEIDYNLKVLVVEDFGVMRGFICNSLRDMGFANILEAEDGQAALELLRREEVGLIITDWHMPRLGGVEFVKEVRSDPKNAALPIIMLTGDDEKESLFAAAQARVNSYIVKPFTPAMLQDTIEMVFYRIEARPQ